jgi:hypothetical protein
LLVIYPTKLFLIAEDFVAFIKLAYFDAKLFGFTVLKGLLGSTKVELSNETGRVAKLLASPLCFLPDEFMVDSFLFIALRLYDYEFPLILADDESLSEGKSAIFAFEAFGETIDSMVLAIIS